MLRAEALAGSTALATLEVTAYGNNTYQAASTAFTACTLNFTATTSTTTIRFSDYTLSANSNSCDGMLDLVAVTVAPPGLTSPWTNADIGSAGVTGLAAENAGVYTIDASGSDIWGSADSFHFAWQTGTGNCDITARVTAVENTDPWAKAGVMIRESNTAESPHVMTVITPSNGASFMYRLTSAGTSAYAQSTGKTAPYYVKLTRVDNVFTSFISPDAVNWTQVGTPKTIVMPPNVSIGLCVTAHSNATLNTSTFDNVTINP